jgi:glutamine amidotransferase-like uncharacterized protein
MPDTFTKIATVTVGAGGAANMVFSSIPQTYTDLCIKVSARGTNTTGSMYVSFNAISANYNVTVGYGDGASAASTNYLAASELQFLGANNISSSGASIFSNVEIYIPSYTDAVNKAMSVEAVIEDNVASGATVRQGIHAGFLTNTAAISTVTLRAAANFAQYSKATLYGISKS